MEEMKEMETRKKGKVNRFSVNLSKMEEGDSEALISLFKQVNDKEFGKKIDWMEIAKFAMLRLAENESQIKELQESSMRGEDLLKIEHEKFLAKNPDKKMSLNEFLVYKVVGKKGLDKIQ